VDKQSNIYVTGSLVDETRFSSSPKLTGNVDKAHAFILKLRPDGKMLWVDTDLKSEGGITSTDIALDGQGNILVTGAFSGYTDFDGYSTTSGKGLNSHRVDLFVAKLDSKAKLLWNKVGGSTGTDDKPGKVEVDAAGNVYMAGWAADSPLPGGAWFGFKKLSRGPFLVKFKPNGDQAWLVQPSGALSVGDLSVLPSGIVYWVGEYKDGANFGKHTLKTSGYGTYVAKQNSDGKFLWATSLAVGLNAGIGVDSQGNCFVGGSGAEIAKVAPDGKHLWSKNLCKAAPGQHVIDLAVNSQGNPVVYGNALSESSILSCPGGSALKGKGAYVLWGTNAGTLLSASIAKGIILHTLNLRGAVATSLSSAVAVGDKEGSFDFDGLPVPHPSGSYKSTQMFAWKIFNPK